MGIAKVRQMYNEKFMSIKAETPEVHSVKDIHIKTTPVRLYAPNENQDLPVILYIHGGAWVAGTLDTHDNLARYLCRGAQAQVVSVGYTNAPEGKFPLALDQCNDALQWILHEVKPSRLAVVGDSAGGNMAAVLCLIAPGSIDLQVLINPVIDNSWGGTLEPQGDHFDDERWIAAQYLDDPKDAANPHVSPIYAKDLSHLPPALILLAELDMFRPDAIKYGERLAASGVPTNMYTQWGVGHLAGNGGRASPLAQESLDVAVAALRGVFRYVQK